MADSLYSKLNSIREEYRHKMNVAADRAQQHAAIGEIDEVSISSTESERYREAFSAINLAIAIVEADGNSFRATLREVIAALDVAAIALDAAGDKLAASVATVAIGNARKVLGDDL